MTVPAPVVAERGAARNELLTVEGLTVEFGSAEGSLRVVEDVSLSVATHETLGIVGESGSGKSVTSLAVMGLIPSSNGRVHADTLRFDGHDLQTLPDAEMRRLRGNDLSMIFQEPMTSLNPAFTVGNQIAETVRVHERVSRARAKTHAIEMLDRVGIPDPHRRVKDYPHAFSGGMRQRAMIAMALANDPKLLIADEPTTALDVTIQAQILELLRSLQRDTGMAIIFVTHDLGVVAEICDQVVVMYAGQVVEHETVDDLFARPRHPYSEGLMASMPQATPPGEPLPVIPGQVARPDEVLPGCRFAPRCAYAPPRCVEAPFALLPVGTAGALVRCGRVDELELVGRHWKPPTATASPPVAPPATPLLRVEQLRKGFPGHQRPAQARGRPRQSGRRRELHDRAGRDARPGG